MINDMLDPDWWKNATVYQIYPRSFRDASGDGIGDLRGVRSGLPYLTKLGVDAIWLTPFYPSPLVDGGYDVADYRNVDPRLGTMDDFDALVHDAHDSGIKVIVDIVPNHCSNQHPWFQQALKDAPDSPMRQRFVFRKGKGPNGSQPPSNWLSGVGGSAWEPCGDGWYYLHLFTKEQPDFNWDNEEVRKDFLKTLAFWSDHGVDGFRIDVSHGLAKDLAEPLRDRPDPADQEPLSDKGDDPLFDRDEVHDIYREWRKVFNEYNPPRMAVGESWTPITDRVYDYARSDELGSVFDFSLSKCDWDRQEYQDAIERTWNGFRRVGGSPSWVLGNHDVPRVASRLALPKGADVVEWVTSAGTRPVINQSVGQARARAAGMLILALPGTAYIYQGDELGLPEDLDIKEEDIQDPSWERSNHKVRGRDGCRVPLPWTVSETNAYGFSSAKYARPWLPQPSWFSTYAVQREDGRQDSALELYRKALALRRQWVVAEGTTTMEILKDGDPRILHIRLSTGLHCLLNFGPGKVGLNIDGTIVLCSDDIDEKLQKEELRENSCVWFVE